jgi:hypothetical protein
MPTPSPRSRNSTRKSPSPKPKSKRPYTRRTGREKIGSRIGKIEKAVGEIKSLVDSHCGDTALKTARAAAVAAAEEVLEATGVTPSPAPMGEFPPGVYGTTANGFRRLAPGENNLSANFPQRRYEGAFNTPPPLETLRPATVGVTKSRKARKLAANAAKAAAEFEAVANSGAPVAAVAKPKSMGPKLWNEFLKNYMANQAAKGRKITRLDAMAEAGPNYRRKHGLPEPKPKKPKTLAVAAGANAVQVAPVEEPAVNTLAAAAAKTKKVRKGVKVLAPGSLVAKTPGRVSPSVNLAEEGDEFGNMPLNPNTNLFTRTPNGNNGSRTPNGSPAAGNNGSRTPNGSPAVGNNGSRTPNGSPAVANRTPNNSFPLSPATYGYEDEGMNANLGQRRVTVGGDEYYLGDNGGLFKRSGNTMEEWVGYLEPGGEIRYTNAPE